jgi:hypothetical protein
MANNITELEPIVLDLPIRGLSAIDYIDYFDEGLYGPDKPYFVARYKNLKQLSEQMDKCLALQTTEGSLIHYRREHIADKWVEPLISPEEEYPQRAYYAIRFMLRIRFYGDFAYIDLGKKWEEGDIEAIKNGTFAVLPSQLEVINKCWIADQDAEYIKELICSNLSYTGNEKYDASSASVVALSQEELEKLEEAKLEAAAIFLTDGESVLGDAEGALNIA